MSKQYTLVLALGSLVFGGCCYCDSSFDYCGPLFGGAHDPYYGDCGSFHRVGTAFGFGEPGLPVDVQGSPMPGEYYTPPTEQPALPNPGPTNGETLRAETDIYFEDDLEEVDEVQGPLLFNQGKREAAGVVRQDR